MKKITSTIVLSLILSLSSCRISKTITMLNAKSNSKLSEEQFLLGKNNEIMYLNLSQGTKSSCLEIWKEEKDKLTRVDTEKNEEIAPVVYDSEMKFRALLSSDKLAEYKKIYRNKATHFFLNDKQLSEIKRIYIDKK
ncbi:hypothetical protein [Flavobacterium sp. UBA4197]|uniref:hypothetical protein n=1 Tax=Flavobacterium sp. UBA4197 TaxID=1946546 RepID=UPI0025808BB7|nr:hypothetical protein [Flavobacterium sp. UBA4197]